MSNMIRSLILSMMMLGAACSMMPVSYAQEEAAATTEETAATPSVPDMLKEVEYLTKAKPKQKKVVVYYILRSHANCGYCRALVPDLIAAYKAMKGKGAELIMLSGDSDLKVAKEWAKSAGMTYPIVTNETTGKVDVPAGGGGYPNITVVTANGEVLDKASGKSACTELVNRWKEFVKDAKKAEKEAKSAAKKAAKKAKKEAAEEADAAEDSEA